MSQPIQVFDSQGTAYHDAFAVFLAHTDQKTVARAWLDQLASTLPNRRVLIDAGAGTGQTTAWLTGAFARTIAAEPNPSLRADLAKACPQAEVLGETILDAKPAAQGDLVLCSHVLYYIEDALWMAHLEKMASWLAPEGVLVVILQNHETDCMKMLDHFLGRHFDLGALGRQFAAQHGGRYQIDIANVPAVIQTKTFETAMIVAEFMLNLLPLPAPPARAAVEAYVQQHFATADGYRFTCNQDFLQIRPR